MAVYANHPNYQSLLKPMVTWGSLILNLETEKYCIDSDNFKEKHPNRDGIAFICVAWWS